ncbi:MAG: glycoside hydrolase family 5 protein, partial [Paludibacteraceae bacterium]
MNKLFIGLKRKLMIVSLCLAALGLFPIRAEIIEGKTATEITNRMTAGWNLGNTLDANSNVGLGSETSWGNPKTTQAMIDAVKAAGFNTIRIPVSWGKQTKNNGTYTYAIDSQWLARVKEVVEYCFNDGLFVILNIHHDNSKSYYYPSSSYKTQSITYVKDIWTQLANEFADYDQHLIFESLNEPRLVGTSDEWWFNVSNPSSAVKDAIDVINQLNQTAIDAIRGVNKGYNADRVVMCPGYCASLDGCITSNFKLPNDNIADRIAVSVHAYTPYTFCMDTNPGTSVFSDNLKNDVKYLFEKLRS